MWKRLLISGFILLILVSNGIPAWAQDEPSGPIYVVQAGDTLWDIAFRFGVSVDELVQANNITDPSNVKAGDELVIPGLSGFSGKLQTRPLEFGETLQSLSRAYDLPISVLSRLNHLTSPAELYIGQQLILPLAQQAENSAEAPGFIREALGTGETLLELAVLHGSSTWNISFTNGISEPSLAMPGEILKIQAPSGEPDGIFSRDLIPQIASAEITPSVVAQGKTLVVKLTAPGDLSIHGEWMGHPLSFFYLDGSWIALQGVYAMADPGLYPMDLNFSNPNGLAWSFNQNVRVKEGDYIYDPDLIVDPATIDPQVTQPENEQWSALTSPVTPQKLWQGIFSIPVDKDFAECYPSRFGNRRSYNDSGYLYFHSGLDFCGAVGNSIYAPATGVVVFTGQLSVRGNATVIDHGWGVYTAYMHQSEILVQVGDRVEAGQLIGKVGNTGRVTGPHLHWEVWVGGVQVDPLDWLQSSFP